MKPGSVIVDVAIDQGGCVETSRPTTHADPTYTVDDVVHYCVTNMPGAVPRTSAFALNNATLPYVRAIADQGWEREYGRLLASAFCLLRTWMAGLRSGAALAPPWEWPAAFRLQSWRPIPYF